MAADRNVPPPTPARRAFRVISFPGAGFDTVFQMGVAHAFLVARRQAPDMAAGLSVGSITATALADVLATGADAATETEREERQAARLCALLEAFRTAPETVLKGFIPDPLETNSSHALKPVELPRHFLDERRSRREAVASRTGLIRLFDHLLRVRVTVKLLAQLSRVAMGWNAAAELAGAERWRQRAALVLRLWMIVARNLLALSGPVALAARVQLWAALGLEARTEVDGVEAGHIIFRRGAWWRKLRDRLLWFTLGFVPLLCLLGAPVGLLLGVVLAPVVSPFVSFAELAVLAAAGVWILLWAALLVRGNVFRNVLKHFRIYRDLGDSHAFQDALVQNFDPEYFGAFDFDENVRCAIRQARPTAGNCASRRRLQEFSDRPEPIAVVPFAANLGTGRLEPLPPGTAIVDALMCACAAVPVFQARTIQTATGPATFIDGNSVSKDPIVPVYEEACRRVAADPAQSFDRLRIISAPLLPYRPEGHSASFQPYTGLVEVAYRARDLQRFQDILLDKGLIDRLSRALNGRPATVTGETGQPETFFPAKVRLVAPAQPPRLGLRLLQAGSAARQRDLINTAAADGCRAFLERLVTDALPDTRTPEERRLLLEPDEEQPDEWPHRDPAQTARLRDAVDHLRQSGQTLTRADGGEFVPCRKLLAAWGGLTPLPGSSPDGGPGVAEVCGCCVSCPAAAGEPELRQHIRLPRRTPTPFAAVPPPENPRDEPAVVFLFSGGVFRGVFQVGFANAVSELDIQPDVIAGSSVGTIVGALTGRVFQRPAGAELAARQHQIRRLAATFLTIDRFVLTDRFADFIRHFSIHAAAADFSLHDLDLVFRRYEHDATALFGKRMRRIFSGLERLFYLSPFEVLDLTRLLRAGAWQEAAKLGHQLAQDVADRYGVGLEILGPEPLQQLIDGFVFDSRPAPGASFDLFGFPLIGTTTNLTRGQLEILRSTHPGDPRLTQGLLAGSAFPALFRPRWSWEVYRHPDQMAQYSDGGIMDNLPLGAVVEYLWGKDGNAIYARRPTVPHLILTATLEPEKADWTAREDLDQLSWMEIRARAKQLRYNGKIGKFQQGQRDIRRIIAQRAAAGDPDVSAPDLPLNLDVLAVKPRWTCGSFAFHPMLGFSRQRQAESIAHGCASTLAGVAEHFSPANHTHAVDGEALRAWARRRGIRLDQLPEPAAGSAPGALAFGPAALTEDEQRAGACWFRRPDPVTGRRPVCPFHPASPAARETEDISPALQKIYAACGNRSTHEP